MHIFLIHRHKKNQLKSTYSEKEVQVLCCYIFYKEVNHNTICFMIRMFQVRQTNPMEKTTLN